MPARLVVVALAAAVIVVMAGRLRDDHDCTRAQDALTAMAYRETGTSGARGAAAAAIAHHCTRSVDLASAAALFAASGDRRAAHGLAATAVGREPRDFTSWVAVALTTPRSDRRAVQAAVARARALNPRWQVPAALQRSGAPGGGP